MNEYRHVIGKSIKLLTTDRILILLDFWRELMMFVYLCAGVAQVWPDASGTRLVFVDEKSDAFLLNPVRI